VSESPSLTRFVHPWRVVGFAATTGWIVALPILIVIDPTTEHGPHGEYPPLWGWWLISSAAMLVLTVVGYGFWLFLNWAFAGTFERVPVESLQQRIDRLERELKIGD
jgi:hypothetical protein